MGCHVLQGIFLIQGSNNQTHISCSFCTAGRFFTAELPGKHEWSPFSVKFTRDCQLLWRFSDQHWNSMSSLCWPGAGYALVSINSLIYSEAHSFMFCLWWIFPYTSGDDWFVQSHHGLKYFLCGPLQKKLVDPSSWELWKLIPWLWSEFQCWDPGCVT